jgi:hypothetical protein
MPDPLPIIQAQIQVANIKDFTYKRGDGSAAVRRSVGHKNPDGTWLNLTVFDDVLFPIVAPGNVLNVGYTEKYATEPNGAPKLYNGVQTIYRTIRTASLVSGTQQAQGSAPGASATPTKAPYDPDLGARQTAANDAVHCANTEAEVTKKFDITRWLDTFDVAFKHIHNTLLGKSNDEFDVMMDAAKEKLAAEPVADIAGPDDTEFDGTF